MSELLPNTTQTPNLYYDRTFGLLTDGENKTLQYAIRRTLGFHKQSDRISISQFMRGNGRIGKDGRPVEIGTLLSKGNQIKSCQSLVEFGILIEVSDNDGAKNEGKEWRLQLDESKIDFDGLWARYEMRHKAAKKRMKNIVAAASACPSYGQAEPGLYDGHPPVHDMDTPLSISWTHRNKDRNKDRNTDHAHEESDGDESIELTWGLLMETCNQDKEQAAAVWQLQEAFCESSSIKRPDIDTEYGRKELQRDWWPVILAMYKAADGDLEAAKAGVTAAVGDMLAWKATAVSGPWSIKKKFTGALNAQRQAQATPAAQTQNQTYQHLNAVPVGKLLGM